jgi:hypothetical protein
MVTSISDLVMVYIDKKLAFFARVEDITPDVKPGWWQVTLLVLTNPPQIFTWILQECQINGEAFTMGGTQVFLEKVISPVVRSDVPDFQVQVKEDSGKLDKKEGGKVVSLFERKRET